MTIDVQALTPVNRQFYTLWIGQFLPLLTGTEQVFILPEGATTSIPLIDRSGNIVRAGEMRGARVSDCGCYLRPARYRLRYGSDSLPTGGTPVFIVWEGLCPFIFNGAAGALDTGEGLVAPLAASAKSGKAKTE
jgi:hypothetical protein